MNKGKYLFLLLIVVGTFNSSINAQDSAKLDTSRMKTYFFVMLTSGKQRNQDSVNLQKIQQGHLANILKLEREGKLVVAGPFLDESNWRGIFIFDVKTKEEVEKLIKTDPAITSGRLNYEIHPWMTQKGSCLK